MFQASTNPSDKRNLSMRLIERPSRLNQVNFFPIKGGSTSPIALIKPQNSSISTLFWNTDAPFLSFALQIELKSPAIHHSPFSKLDLSFTRLFHKIRFFRKKHDE